VHFEYELISGHEEDWEQQLIGSLEKDYEHVYKQFGGTDRLEGGD
jgi:hypothetical protein